jgi:cysteine sulfinate desulfinase/cysteine desulfurase-like protein
MATEFDGDFAPGSVAFGADVAEVAEERDQYATEARDMRERLAAANLTITEQSSLIGALRAQLHAAGIAPANRPWQVGAAA